jgi:hypothetical protein
MQKEETLSQTIKKLNEVYRDGTEVNTELDTEERTASFDSWAFELADSRMNRQLCC